MDTITLKVGDGTDMHAYVAHPESGERQVKKGIIVIQEAFGVNDYMKRVAQRFTPHGFVAIAPEMFHRSAPAGFTAEYTDYPSIKPHMEAMTLPGQEADLKACFDWLVERGVPKDKIAVIGFCMGGRAAFLANATLPVAASISFYGGGIAQSLLDKAPDLHAAQMLVWGGKDAHILPEHRRAVVDALVAAGKSYIDVTFGDADHGFACDARASYHEPSAKEAWALVDAFLATKLG